MSITGQRLKERRKQLEMSADDVASQLGVSRSTIFRYENGHIEKIPVNVLEKLAEILKTTPAYLIGRKEQPIDEKFQSIAQNALSGDMDMITKMAEMYLKLTDIGKKKAYDYVIDLTEQSKYIKNPDDSQEAKEQLEIEVTKK